MAKHPNTVDKPAIKVIKNGKNIFIYITLNYMINKCFLLKIYHSLPKKQRIIFAKLSIIIVGGKIYEQ